MTDSSDVVHNRVAMLRAERRISRRELADALGVHYQTIGYLERGEYSPSLHVALRIAAYFEATRLAGFTQAEATIYFGQPRDLGSELTARLGALAPMPADSAQRDFLARFKDLIERF